MGRHNHASTTLFANVGLMLGQRLKRWYNIKPELSQHLVFIWRPHANPELNLSICSEVTLTSTACFYRMFFADLLSIVGSLRDREVACSASDLKDLNFESCVWRAVSSHSSHHPPSPLSYFIMLVVKLNYDHMKVGLRCRMRPGGGGVWASWLDFKWLLKRRWPVCEMIEMTLSSRHRIRNSSPGGLRSSTLPLGHGGSPQYWLSHVDGKETFVSFKPPRPGTEPRTLAWKAAVLTTTLGPPPLLTIARKICEQHVTLQVVMWFLP